MKNTLLRINKPIEGRVLVIGEFYSNRSRVMAELLKQCLEKHDLNEVAVIDLSPIIISVEGLEVGGRIDQYIKLPVELSYYSSNELVYPQLSASNLNEFTQILNRNSEIVNELIEEYMERSPPKVLFINEVNMLLSSMSLKAIDELTNPCETSIISGFYGVLDLNDYGSGLNARVNSLIEGLIEKSEVIFYVPPMREVFEDT